MGAAGQGKLSDERCRGTRLLPSAPTRGLTIPRHCDVDQNPPDGCVSAPSPPVFEIQKKECRYRTLKIKSTVRISSRFLIFRKIVCQGFTNEIPAFEDFVTKGRRTHHLARSHTGSKCACGAKTSSTIYLFYLQCHCYKV